MNDKYKKSISELELYMKVTNEIPSEKNWNNYAKEEKLLSSKSMEYFSGIKFNKMCRKMKKRGRQIFGK